MQEIPFRNRHSALRITLMLGIVIAVLMSLTTVLVGAADNESVLSTAEIRVDKARAESAEMLRYQVVVRNPSRSQMADVSIINELPAELTLVPNSGQISSSAASLQATDDANGLQWFGSIRPNETVVLSYLATLNTSRIQVGSEVVNKAYVIQGDVGSIIEARTGIVAQTATAGRDVARDLSNSSKAASSAEAQVGDTITYTIVLSNSSNAALPASMTDALPNELTYVNGSLMTTGGMTVTSGFNSASDTITWTGTISAMQSATVVFETTIQSSSLISGSVVTNTAQIVSAGGFNDVVATVTITQTESPTKTTYAPIVFRTLDAPSLSLVTKPNSSNTRVIGWTSQGAGVSYEIQQDDNAAFSSPSLSAHSDLTASFTPPASYNNTIHYRVRTVSSNGQRSAWSNVVPVTGSYFDDFNTTDSGWEIRRTTFLEEVRGFYETNDSWYVMQIDDRWDWGISSPLREAPEPPYTIEARVEAVTDGNLISFGFITRGRYDGGECVVRGSSAGLYERLNCFPTFFNTNIINQAGGLTLKLEWEKIDELVWCPNCGGSPMKRLSNNEASWKRVTPIPGTSQDANNKWNIWKIDVHETHQTLYVNGREVITYTNSDYSDQRYFGLFASTDEYNNSTWRIDYLRVTPID